MSHVLTSAEQVRILTDDLAREAKHLVNLIAHDPAGPLDAVELLSPQALEAVENDLRHIAGVLSTLSQAGRAAFEDGEPWNFVGKDDAQEAARRLISFALEDTTKF